MNLKQMAARKTAIAVDMSVLMRCERDQRPSDLLATNLLQRAFPTFSWRCSSEATDEEEVFRKRMGTPGTKKTLST